MKLLLFFIFFFTNSSLAQHAMYIPDYNLREYLKEQGFTTNDSLDPRKISGLLQLDISKKDIKNIECLQYFTQLQRLYMSHNKIEDISYLPPNLAFLDCSFNLISHIDSLPKKLAHLDCSHNRIKNISKTNDCLNTLKINDNQLTRIPKLPETIQNINYYNNNIKPENLPAEFKNTSCVSTSQNCLPLSMINWNILKIGKHKLDSQIDSLTVTLYTSHSWGFGSEKEVMKYKPAGLYLVTNKILHHYTNQNKLIDTSYTIRNKFYFSSNKLTQIIKNASDNKLKINIKEGDNIFDINLYNKKNAAEYFSGLCSDCSFHTVEYKVYSHKKSIVLSYSFDSPIETMIPLYKKDEAINLNNVIQWLYAYQIMHLTLGHHELTKYYFNPNSLYKVINWAK